MAHYLVTNAAGEIKHITGQTTARAMEQHGWKVIEQWFGR
jgi:hypothetical protein